MAIIKYKNFTIKRIRGFNNLWYYSVFDEAEQCFVGRFYCNFEALKSKLKLMAVNDWQTKLM